MWFVYLALAPAFDNSGKVWTPEILQQDVSELRFAIHGLHPKSIINTVWDLIMTFIFLSAILLVPFLISFDGLESVQRNVSVGLTVFFGADMVISAITPISKVSSTIICDFVEYEKLRPSLVEWFKEWLTWQAPWALAAMIPFDILAPSMVDNEHLLLIRICSSRCAILKRFHMWIDRVTGTSVSQIIPIAIGIFVFIHLNACEMYYVGKATGFVGWAVAFENIDRATNYEYYCWTILQSVAHMFPNNYIPQTGVEQLIGSGFMILSAVLYAAFIGAISTAISNFNTSGRAYTQKLEQLNDYVKWKNLAPTTEQKMIRYYETKYRGKVFDEDMLLSEMNDSLRSEISLSNTRELIEQVPFLCRNEGDGRDEIFMGRLATALQPQYFVKGDYVTKQGDSGMDMFFILSGQVDVYVGERKVVSLYDGAYFGEIALITKVLRTATVQAARSSVLYRLSYSNFHKIIAEYEDMKLRIFLMAEEQARVVGGAPPSRKGTIDR
ncbi:cyclic nucleotide-binding-like protein [Chytriomyces sp. MP71]|nr:cyclic nucleotide-binding-like protein [Chytriomyces sp. MP71]